MHPPPIDPHRDPFSGPGSFLSLLVDDRPGWQRPHGDGLYLRHCHGFGGSGRHLALLEAVIDGEAVCWRPEADACEFRMLDEAGRELLSCCFADACTLAGRLQGVVLRLTCAVNPHAWAAVDHDGSLRLHLPQSRKHYRFRVQDGTVRRASDWAPMGRDPIVITIAPDDQGACTFTIEEFEHEGTPAADPGGYEQALAASRASWLAFRHPFGPGPADAELARAWERAIGALWSLQVGPAGNLLRPAVYMSKYVMNAVWAWDNCFNALALAGAHDDLAADQLWLFFDHQAADGMIPNCITDTHVHFGCEKPPLHGWFLRELIGRGGGLPDRLQPGELYTPLARLTRWWLEHARWPGEVLPHYFHGDSSGWDNGSTFDGGTPVQTPELAAFLAIQCDLLAEWARNAGRDDEADGWSTTSADLVTAIRSQLGGDNGLQARRLGGADGPATVAGTSLLPSLGLILGPRLGTDLVTATVTRLRRFLTPHGLATDLPQAPIWRDEHFYWRGPAWAPSTHLAAVAAAGIGEIALAATITERYCRTCARSGFYENFDTRSGEGLCDSQYSWTAAVFIDLARRFLPRATDPEPTAARGA